MDGSWVVWAYAAREERRRLRPRSSWGEGDGEGSSEGWGGVGGWRVAMLAVVLVVVEDDILGGEVSEV